MNQIGKMSFVHSGGVLVYIAIVATIMNNSERLFGQMTGYLGPIAFLLLFTLSALVVGALILGKPLILYLDGHKKEAIALLGATAGWLGLFTIIALVIMAVI